MPDFAAGDVMARIEIPTIGLDAKVVSGVAPDDLKQGPGHYPDTPMPGQFGNSAIAGHRTTYGQPFYRLDEVKPGDEIVVTTVQGRFVYRATASEVVDADRSDVVATTDPDVARLTLTTCHPRYSATQAAHRQRRARRGRIGGAAASRSSRSRQTTTTTTTDRRHRRTRPSSTDTVLGADDRADDRAGHDDTGRGRRPSEVADAFAHGWFSDDAAFPQVALWGFALTAIGIGSWLLSRAVGRNWVGALVGIVPFVVALYFFFQNVNRLLPAAL